MYLNYKNEERVNPNLQTSFGGLNRQDAISENEFSEIKNMSSKKYPLLTTREKRGVLKNFAVISDMSINNVDSVSFNGETIPKKSFSKKAPADSSVWVKLDEQNRIAGVFEKKIDRHWGFKKYSKNNEWSSEIMPTVVFTKTGNIASKDESVNTYGGTITWVYSQEELGAAYNSTTLTGLIIFYDNKLEKVLTVYHRDDPTLVWVLRENYEDVTFSKITLNIKDDDGNILQRHSMKTGIEFVPSVKFKSGKVASLGADNTYTGIVGFVYPDVDDIESWMYSVMNYRSDSMNSVVMISDQPSAHSLRASIWKVAYIDKNDPSSYAFRVRDDYTDQSYRRVKYYQDEMQFKVVYWTGTPDNKKFHTVSTIPKYNEFNGKVKVVVDAYLITDRDGTINYAESEGVPSRSSFKENTAVIFYSSELNKITNLFVYNAKSKTLTYRNIESQQVTPKDSSTLAFSYFDDTSPMNDPEALTKMKKYFCGYYGLDYDVKENRQYVVDIIKKNAIWVRTTGKKNSIVKDIYNYDVIEDVSWVKTDKFYTINLLDSSDKTTQNFPTGFTCQGAWIYSAIRYDGVHRLFVNNLALNDIFQRYTISDIATSDEFFTNVDEYVEKQKDIKRQIVVMGAKAVVFPEKYYINLFDYSDKGSLENKRYPLWKDAVKSSVITLSPCTVNGTEFKVSQASDQAPEKPSNGQIWLDTSGEVTAYKIYDASSKSWNAMATTYVRIGCKGAFKGFKQWDAIKISGFSSDSLIKLNKEYVKDEFENLVDLGSDGVAVGADETGFSSIIKDALNNILNKVNENDEDYIALWKKFISDYLSQDQYRNIDKQINALNQDGVILYRCTDDYIVVAGMIDAVCKLSSFTLKNIDNTKETFGRFAFERLVPDMDFVCECNNRLWGCKFGYDAEKKQMLNTIYACKQGDPTNWRAYLGVSTDSYALTIGADGFFTGCCNFNGYPTFFKQKKMFRIYGNYPGNFQLVQKDIRGVGIGLHNSICICNNNLFYATNTDFVVFNGASVQSISDNLGELDIADCVVGTDSRRIYWCVSDSTGKKSLYVFDSENGVWMQEDCGDILFFANDAHVLYAIERWKAVENGIDRYRIITMTEKVNTIYKPHEFDDKPYPDWDDDVRWEFSTGEIGFGNPYDKYIQKISVRAKIDKSAQYNVYISYDNKPFEKIIPTNTEVGLNVRDFTFKINRCDYFKLKFVGKGDVTFISIYKTYVNGSDKK